MKTRAQTSVSPAVNETLFVKASDKAYNVIYGKILDGSLTPGTRLAMRKMAALSGVSVIPVIEALNRLVEDGLVETRPQWGYFVAVPTRHQVRNQLILREAVECQVARILAETLSVASRKKLLKTARAHDKVRADFFKGKVSEKEVERTHYELHLLMAQSTGVDSLVETLDRIKLFFLLLKADAINRQTHLPADWHEQLARVIVEGSVDEAEAMMRRHVRDSYDRILNSVPESYPLP